MKDILAKLRETLRNPLMRDEMHKHMQDLLREFPLAKDKTKLEWPLRETLNSLSLQQEEEDEGSKIGVVSMSVLQEASLIQGTLCNIIANNSRAVRICMLDG